VSKPSHREKILTEGLRVVQERGFAGASVRDIVVQQATRHGWRNKGEHPATIAFVMLGAGQAS